MNFSLGGLLAGFIFGVWGFYFFKLAKRNGHIPLLALGVALMIYPYFIDRDWLVWGVGIALTGVGFWLKSDAGIN